MPEMPAPCRRGAAGRARVLLVAAAVLLAAAGAGMPGPFGATPAQAQAVPTPPGGGPMGPRLRGDPTRFNDSIVRIVSRAISGANSAETLGPQRVGTGVIIGERLVLTIGYLLLETEQVEVTTPAGKRLPATVAAYDHGSGFGLVRTLLPMDGRALELGDSDTIAERQRLLTIGQGEPEATELMVLSRKPFAGAWEYLVERPIFTFPPVNNWSGAALITEDGKLVGIGSLIVQDAASGRAGVPGNLYVPVNLIKPIMADLLANGRRTSGVQPWIGVATEVVRGHLMVVRVSRNSPAEGAGLDAGDIILSVGNEKVTDMAEFYRRLYAAGPAGTTVTLKILKGGDVREVKVKSMDRMDSLRRPSGV